MAAIDIEDYVRHFAQVFAMELPALVGDLLRRGDFELKIPLRHGLTLHVKIKPFGERKSEFSDRYDRWLMERIIAKRLENYGKVRTEGHTIILQAEGFEAIAEVR